MKKQFDALRPFEKRVVVGVGVALFAVLNVAFVFPYFSQWSKVKTRRIEAQVKLEKYERAARLAPVYKGDIAKFVNAADADVPSDNRGNDFLQTINLEQARSGVRPMSSGVITSSTNNAFFVELRQTIQIQAGETNLVDFLYNLGSGKSLIRVRSLNLRPDPPRLELAASVTLVASYQKVAAKPAGAATGSSEKSGRSTPSPTSTAKSP
jgi:hypothetical protein